MGCNCTGEGSGAPARIYRPTERVTVAAYCFDDANGNEVCSQNWSGFTIKAQRAGVTQGRIVHRTYQGATIVEERLVGTTSTGV